MRHRTWELRQMQGLPLEAKIVKSQLRVREWYEHWEGQVYVAFSGGKDSTVLLHLVRELYPDVPAVFCDTGLEYPEIKKFARQTEGVEVIRPKMNFRRVLEHYGYPIVSKRTAQYIREVRRTKSKKLLKRRMTGYDDKGKFMKYAKIPDKWMYLLDAPFKIDDRCCDVMKKRPFAKYEKDTGRKAILGSMASDANNRELEYLKSGCNAFDLKRPKSTPLGFWMEEDIWEYLKIKEVPYSPLYDMGFPRSGCVFCAFGVHLEESPNRFQIMYKTHPRLHNYCINKLGFAEVLDYINVPYLPEGDNKGDK